MNQVVHFIETKERRRLVPIPNHYEFRPNGRLQGLQRAAWKFLSWCNALQQAREEKFEVVRVTVDSGDVVERLLRARGGLLDQEPRELLIGSEDFAELMGSPKLQMVHSFQAEYHSQRRLLGLKVRIIPWMRGVLVMP